MSAPPAPSVMSRRGAPLAGRVRAVGDASISIRAVLLAGLASGQTTIDGLAETGDVLLTVDAMRALGARFARAGDRWTVDGVGNGCLLESSAPLYFGGAGAGAGARLAMGLVGTYDMQTAFAGGGGLGQAPMTPILEPLRLMGVQVLDTAPGDRLPLTLHGPRRAAPIEHHIPAASAELKTAILLAGLNAPGITTVVEPLAAPDPIERMLKSFGAAIEVETDREGSHLVRVEGRGNLRGQWTCVTADASASAFAVVAALIVPGSDVVIENVSVEPSRMGLINALLEMGASIEIDSRYASAGGDAADLRVRASDLKGITLQAGRVAPLDHDYPVLALAAAFAEGETVMEGLDALPSGPGTWFAEAVGGLEANGVQCEKREAALVVRGRPGGKGLGGGRAAAHLDQRSAMSPLVLGMASEKPVTFDDVSMIGAGFDRFVDLMRGVGARIE